nr:hypothetical protein [Mycolicibacterium agri]
MPAPARANDAPTCFWSIIGLVGMTTCGTPNDNARIAVLCPPWPTTSDAVASTSSWSSQACRQAFGGTRRPVASMPGPTVTVTSTASGASASRMFCSIRRCPAKAFVLRLTRTRGTAAGVAARRRRTGPGSGPRPPGRSSPSSPAGALHGWVESPSRREGFEWQPGSADTVADTVMAEDMNVGAAGLQRTGDGQLRW